MRQKNLLKALLLSGIGVLGLTQAIAQEPMHESIAGNIGGTRFVVTEPASVAGIKRINYATWGAAASPTISGAVVEKAYDTIAAATLLNGTGSYPALTGKFALVFRGGGISFSDKVNRCISKGAIGVIIVNNIPGDPVGMAPTPAGSTASVPVLMISDVDGQAISNEIKTGTTVKITLGTWNTGGTHDLGILSSYQTIPHALNIPLHQLTGSAGTEAYKHFIGGAVANYGAATETGITVTDSIYWIPTGGAASFVTTKQYTVPSISVTDSIRFGFGAAGSGFELTPPATTGRYEFRHSIAYSMTDDFPQDNSGKATQYVTDSIFSKGNYDFANHRPMYSVGIQPKDATAPFMMGNMYYVKHGGYAARHLQFSLSINDLPTLDGLSVFANIYKWQDAGSTKDSFVQASELTIVGQSAMNFSTADSSGKTLTLKFVDIADPDSDKPIILDDNSWYYVVVEVPVPCFIGMDQINNNYTRSFAKLKHSGAAPGSAIYDLPVGFTAQAIADFTADGTNIVVPYPFAALTGATTAGGVLFVDSSMFDKNNMIPAIALLMSKEKPTVSVPTVTGGIGKVAVYPNPADNGMITVDVMLNRSSKRVEYRLTDMLGRALETEVHQNVLNEKFQMSTAKLATGNYFLMILSDDGVTNRKITVRNN